jgi:hypothetical protein
MNQEEYMDQMDDCYAPEADQSLGILQPMNPVVDPLIPSDYFDPVYDMQPYGFSQPLGSVQDVLNVLQVTDFLFGK